MDGQAGADRGGHRLVDQADPAGAGVQAAVVDRAALHRRGAEGTHTITFGFTKPRAVMHLADEVLDHLLGDLEVGDDAVAHGADRLHVPGRAAQHLLGFDPHRVGPTLRPPTLRRATTDGSFRTMPLALHVDEGVGGAEIDGDIVGYDAEEGREHAVPWRGANEE